MRRTFNYTGRTRIARNRVTVRLNRDGEAIRSFDMIAKLDGLGFPPSANAYLEAYHRTEMIRYHLGNADDAVEVTGASLAHLAYRPHLRFRLVVVDESGRHGLILGSADGIRPLGEGEGASKKRSILPVEFTDLGQQVWRVVYDGECPALQLNGKIPNIRHHAKSDPRFFMYVYPYVIREILIHMIFVEGVSDTEAPEEGEADWIAFARRILPNEPLPQSLCRPEEESAREEAIRWVDRVVEEFCTANVSMWTKMARQEENP